VKEGSGFTNWDLKSLNGYNVPLLPSAGVVGGFEEPYSIIITLEKTQTPILFKATFWVQYKLN